MEIMKVLFLPFPSILSHESVQISFVSITLLMDKSWNFKTKQFQKPIQYFLGRHGKSWTYRLGKNSKHSANYSKVILYYIKVSINVSCKLTISGSVIRNVGQTC